MPEIKPPKHKKNVWRPDSAQTRWSSFQLYLDSKGGDGEERREKEKG